MLGPRPTRTRPDARAAWDYARERFDKYLTRDLAGLTEEEMADLEASFELILATNPRFNPEELEATHRTGTEDSNSLENLEAQAETYRRWQQASVRTRSRLRQIEMARTLRRSVSNQLLTP